MTKFKQVVPYLSLIAVIGMWLVATVDPPAVARAQTEAEHSITGRIIDAQDEPVREVEVALYTNGTDEPLAEAVTQPNGVYLIAVPDATIEAAHLEYERSHFELREIELTEAEVAQLNQGASLRVDLQLERRIGIAFWIATATFIGMLGIIATEQLQNTVAALLGTAVVLGASAIGASLAPELFIFEFERAIEYVDFEVIFLLLGMMIVIGIIEETGVFQWVAFQAYRISRGQAWVLAAILMAITAVASALLDNVTTMLLMTPITIQIALALDINPLSLLMPEVMASNVGGISTLIGTPTNILIGSYAGLGFSDFLLNLTPGVIMALIGLGIYSLLIYRKEHQQATPASEALLARLDANSEIEQPEVLRKSGVVFGVLLLMFIFGENLHLTPAVSAIIGAVALLIWLQPDIEKTLNLVDWTTLLFFIGMFIVIGAIREVGLIFIVADQIAALVGENKVITQIAIVWSGALMSGVVANIPFAAAMLPVVDFLTRTTGTTGNALFYGLSVGAAMGGNTSLIGSSANLVTAGIAERAGYPITFKRFLIVGFPAMLITVSLGTLWLFIRFFWT